MSGTADSRAIALASIYPAGVDRYIALFLGDPSGSGQELTLTGYARVAHQQWSTIDGGTESTRSNTVDVVFPNITQAGSADYWAVFDSSVGGTLLRYGRLLNGAQQPYTIVFTGLGDQARFLASTFRLKTPEV